MLLMYRFEAKVHDIFRNSFAKFESLVALSLTRIVAGEVKL